MRAPAPTRYRALIGGLDVLHRVFSQLTTMALRHLWRRPVRTGLTVLGTSFSVGLLVTAMFSQDSIDYMIDQWLLTYAETLGKMPQEANRLSNGVDIYWQLLQHPLFVAWQELNAASRTDPELKKLVTEAAKRYDQRRLEIGRQFYTELANVPDDVFDVARDLLRATLEGLAVSNFGPEEATRKQAIINMLKQMMDQLLGDY